MRLVSAAKYNDLLYRYQRVTEARENADKLAADRLNTITRLAGELTQLRDAKPSSPVQHPQPVEGDAELRRQLALAQQTIRGLYERLDDMQASHIADTRELHDLRQGVAS